MLAGKGTCRIAQVGSQANHGSIKTLARQQAASQYIDHFRLGNQGILKSTFQRLGKFAAHVRLAGQPCTTLHQVTGRQVNQIQRHLLRQQFIAQLIGTDRIGKLDFHPGKTGLPGCANALQQWQLGKQQRQIGNYLHQFCSPLLVL